MTRCLPIPGRAPRGLSSSIILFGGALLVALALALLITPPAAATVTYVVPAPADPRICDPVTLTVTGSISSPCYEIVGAKITGPEPIPCLRAEPCPSLFRIEITVREPNPELGAPCPLVITPYLRSFDVGTLPAAEYAVTAVERVVPFAAESVATTLDSSFVSTRFTVRSDSTCQTGEGCYILDFIPDVSPPDDPFPLPLCTATAAPGGTACLDLALLNSVPVGGLQTTVAVAYNRGAVSPAALIHAISVEPTGRARGFQVGWSTDGAHTKLILYSPAGALIQPGRGPVARICYAVPPETVPGVYPVNSIDEIVADSTGIAITQCPTFAPIQGGTICVASPACDVNGDGASDILDVIRIVRCALSQGRDSTAACPDSVAARADCNGDGSIDVRDVICCVRKILRSLRGTEPLRSEAPAGTQPTEIGFAGPLRWINEAEGFATVELKPRDDWGGSQFSLDPGDSPVRIRDMKLLEDPAPDQLEWVTDASGVAHAMLYSTAMVPRSAGTVRIQIALERTPGVGGGTLQLAGVRSGTLIGALAPTSTVNAAVEISEAILSAPALLAARPNPFLGRTDLGFALPSPTGVTLRLYDVAGRLVRTLVEGTMPAGVHRAVWDGTDARGRTVPAGVYFAMLEAGHVQRSERLLLLR